MCGIGSVMQKGLGLNFILGPQDSVLLKDDEFEQWGTPDFALTLHINCCTMPWLNFMGSLVIF